MEITHIEYRKNVLSNCCSCFVIENTNRCSGCNENCEFILQELTAFHKWILATARKQIKGDEEITYQDEIFKIMSLIRLEIINKQNPQAFELMEIVDMGESQFNKETLSRAADMLINTDFLLKHKTKTNPLKIN
tara:strand:- start:1108 stop:1509 length:402 start_codon:yes stop_codon:yes gene_type:complete